MSETLMALKEQGKAVLIMMGVGIVAVLAILVLSEFGAAVPATAGNDTPGNVNFTIQATITAFIAGFAIVGTFAVITMLMIVTKAIIGVARNLKN